jgi:hypothetical protein
MISIPGREVVCVASLTPGYVLRDCQNRRTVRRVADRLPVVLENVWR